MKGFEANVFRDVKVPVFEDVVSVPAGGEVRYSQEKEGRKAKILIRGQYARIEIEMEFVGAPGNFSPYPEWTSDMSWVKKSNLRPVLYSIRARSSFSKWRWNLTSEQLLLENRWVDDTFKLLQYKFDDEDFLDRLGNAAQKRAALNSLLGRTPKHLKDTPLLDQLLF